MRNDFSFQSSEISLNACVDLHTHSSASDGTCTPAELVQAANSLDLAAIAITDHDTVSGIDEALSTADKLPIKLIPGVEISADVSDGALHILGYFIDHHSPALHKSLNWMLSQRESRNIQLIEKLSRLGIPITLEMVNSNAGDGVIGRPHFAQSLIQLNAVNNFNQAFKKYLGKKGKAFIPKVRMPAKDCIETILEAGGIPVLAHPVELSRVGINLTELIRKLTSFGLAGIEVWYSQHLQSETDEYIKLADKFDLVKTGGSDFHGTHKPQIALGKGFGNLRVNYKVVEELLEKRERLIKRRV